MRTATRNYSRRAIRRLPALRAIVKSRVGQHLIQTVRGARAVREPLRFVVLQFAPRRSARYRIRGTDHFIIVRHRTRDVHILNEIFGGTGGRRSYEPPDGVRRVLNSNPSPRILDVGGNVGLFGVDALTRWRGATIRSYEPDPANGAVLAKVIVANGMEDRWSLMHAAVANHAGAVRFTGGLFADSHIVDSLEGPAEATDSSAISVPSVDLFAEDHHVDLLKIDIEGGEWPILADPRLADLGAKVLVLEWHARGCPEADARACAVRLLRGAGYGGLFEVESGAENGVLWACREASVHGC